jgi:hypothetical protein
MKKLELVIKMSIDAWTTHINAIDKTFEELSDEELMREVSPTRNRAIYIMGHLTALHDVIFPLLSFGESLYPELKTIFVDQPDKAMEIPPVQELRAQFKKVNETLLSHFNALSVDDWFTRHANISAEDFVDAPQRNKLSILQSRTIHLAYHRGQIVLITNKK